MAVKTLDDLLAEGVSGRGVLVRSDLNVPLDDGGNITDPGRIIASFPTLKALSDAGAKVVVAAHLGRPKGGPDPKFSLAPVAKGLAALDLGPHVQLAARRGRSRRAGPRGGADRRRRLAAGEHSLRPARDQQGRRRAAALAKRWSNWSVTTAAFVSDGFGVVHRKQASVYDVATLLPHYAGQAGGRRGQSP